MQDWRYCFKKRRDTLRLQRDAPETHKCGRIGEEYDSETNEVSIAENLTNMIVVADMEHVDCCWPWRVESVAGTGLCCVPPPPLFALLVSSVVFLPLGVGESIRVQAERGRDGGRAAAADHETSQHVSNLPLLRFQALLYFLKFVVLETRTKDERKSCESQVAGRLGVLSGSYRENEVECAPKLHICFCCCNVGTFTTHFTCVVCSSQVTLLSPDLVESRIESTGNRIPLERASQKQSSNSHKIPYDRVKRCRERKININTSERVNADVFTQNKRPCPQHSRTPFFFNRPLASHQGEPGSFPGRVTKIFACGNRAGRCRWSAGFFSGISRFPRPFIPALLHTHFALPSSALKSSLLRAAQISSLAHSFTVRKLLLHYLGLKIVECAHAPMQNGVSGQQHVETSLANQRLVTYLLAKWRLWAATCRNAVSQSAPGNLLASKVASGQQHVETSLANQRLQAAKPIGILSQYELAKRTQSPFQSLAQPVGVWMRVHQMNHHAIFALLHAQLLCGKTQSQPRKARSLTAVLQAEHNVQQRRNSWAEETRKPAGQRHRPARFPRARILERPRRVG
ncbi:hypothetical protein PR048_026258 [Dryococelus australis]|uniref:Uncharacterized protein n=1 Tax=Dryococelus australis TaxID=614101 RepID=A0ABQ9GKX3_9NEOP|nr:hypothetical protein PR048_026258 [Dryococelus australis]